jgi:hypothetical protein
MHLETFQFVKDHVWGRAFGRVLDIGGRDVNGSVRPLILADHYWTIDIADGPAVDEVTNAVGWRPDEPYDLVLCLEVFEHTPEWRGILETISASLRPGGEALITCACDPRAPHSGSTGGALPPGEWYENIVAAELQEEARVWFGEVTLDILGRGDVRLHAVKGPHD